MSSAPDECPLPSRSISVGTQCPQPPATFFRTYPPYGWMVRRATALDPRNTQIL